MLSKRKSICNKPLLNEGDKQKRILLQSPLDNCDVPKATGAHIRSKATWREEGERSSACFCRLEKKRQERNAVKALPTDIWMTLSKMYVMQRSAWMKWRKPWLAYPETNPWDQISRGISGDILKTFFPIS